MKNNYYSRILAWCIYFTHPNLAESTSGSALFYPSLTQPTPLLEYEAQRGDLVIRDPFYAIDTYMENTLSPFAFAALSSSPLRPSVKEKTWDTLLAQFREKQDAVMQERALLLEKKEEYMKTKAILEALKAEKEHAFAQLQEDIESYRATLHNFLVFHSNKSTKSLEELRSDLEDAAKVLEKRGINVHSNLDTFLARAGKQLESEKVSIEGKIHALLALKNAEDAYIGAKEALQSAGLACETFASAAQTPIVLWQLDLLTKLKTNVPLALNNVANPYLAYQIYNPEKVRYFQDVDVDTGRYMVDTRYTPYQRPGIAKVVLEAQYANLQSITKKLSIFQRSYSTYRTRTPAPLDEASFLIEKTRLEEGFYIEQLTFMRYWLASWFPWFQSKAYIGPEEADHFLWNKKITKYATNQADSITTKRYAASFYRILRNAYTQASALTPYRESIPEPNPLYFYETQKACITKRSTFLQIQAILENPDTKLTLKQEAISAMRTRMAEPKKLPSRRNLSLPQDTKAVTKGKKLEADSRMLYYNEAEAMQETTYQKYKEANQAMQIKQKVYAEHEAKYNDLESSLLRFFHQKQREEAKALYEEAKAAYATAQLLANLRKEAYFAAAEYNFAAIEYDFAARINP